MVNGRLPASQLATIPGTTQRVRADLAAQTAALRQAFAHRFGKPLTITDSYRPYEVQERIFRQRYTTAGHQGVNDVRWWNGAWWYRRPGTAAAAVPGTSNHGWGTALDFGSRVNVGGSTEQKWMAVNAPRFGWRWPAWARSSPTYEPWHYDATGVVPVANYRHFPGVSIPTPGGTRPDPLEPIMSWDYRNEQHDKRDAWGILRAAEQAAQKAASDSAYARRQNLLLEEQHKALDARIVTQTRAVSAEVRAAIAALAKGQNITAKDIADALLPGLIEPLAEGIGTELGMTVEQVQEAAERAVRAVLGSLND